MKDNKFSITSLGRMPLLSSCLVFCLAVTGCGSDDGPALQPIKPQLPAAESNPVKQIRHQGDVTSCYDWKFTYDQGRLVNATGLMRSSDAQTDGTYQYTSSLAFPRQPCRSQIQAAKKRSFSSMLWDTSNTCRSIKTNTTSNTSTAVS